MTSDNQIGTLAKSVQTLTFLVVLLIIAVGFMFVKDYTGSTSEKTLGETTAVTTTPVPAVTINRKQIQALFNKKQIHFGDKNSKNLFVEFSDPSCPYCHFAAGMNPELSRSQGAQFTLESDGGSYLPPVVKMKELVDQGKAGFVWIYQNGHGNGELSTQALYCAHEKGDFWAVHDLLMSNAGYTLINESLQNDKANIGQLVDFLASVTDAEALRSCLEKDKYAKQLQEDMQLAQTFQAQGTPNFYVNTQNFAGAYSWADMQSALR